MEDMLIMNKLPLPKYYDGQEWQTVSRPRRSSIPKYLHDQLPELKHLYIKRLFQQIGKFNCPGLEYFSSLIKMRRNKSTPRRDQSKQHADQVKEKLQYALITTDRESNIVEELVEEAKTTKALTSRKKKAKSLNRAELLKSGGRNFDNTVELVFRNRKKHLLSQREESANPRTELAMDRVRRIQLLDLEK